MLTFRGLLLLLLAVPLWISMTWVPAFGWVGGGYLLFCLLILGLDWQRAGTIQRFEIHRQHDQKLSLGAENPILLTIRNLSRRPTPFQLRDEPPHRFISSQLIHQGQLFARQSWQTSYYVRPLRRGDYQFGDMYLRWQGPLGLFWRQGRVPASVPVKVYPNLLDVRRYDLLLRQNRLQELGLRHSRLFGEGTEYERLREYLPDDEFRRINWKATARRNRPVTVEYQTERSQTVMAVIDAGRMMQSPVAQMAKLDYVVNAVLLFSYVATGLGDKIGLLTFADQIQQFLSPQAGRGQFYRLLEHLYALEAQPIEPDYGIALSYLRLKQRKRALTIIFTDLSGGMSLSSLVTHVSLLAKHSLPLVVTISDPDVHAAAQQRPSNSLGVYQQVAAQRLLSERQLILDGLRRQGALTLDVPANQLSISVINQYLTLKAKMQL